MPEGKANPAESVQLKSSGYPVPVSDVATDILDPVLRKRAGMTIGLVQSWEEIVGERLAAITRPERIVWPRRRDQDAAYEPATLVVACSGMAAMRVQHETAQIIGRLNAFLGYGAIGRIRIVQKAVSPSRREKRAEPQPTPEEARRIDAVTGAIEDDGLRDSLRRLGASVLAERRKP